MQETDKTPQAPEQETAKQARKKRNAGWGAWLLRFFLSIFLLVALAVAGVYFYAQKTLSRPLDFADPYTISSGDSLQSFLRKLKNDGVIAETLTPRLYARLEGISGKLHTGEYRFARGKNLREVLAQVTSGKGQVTELFTVVEGARFDEFLEKLAAHSGVEKTLAGKNGVTIMRELFDTDTHPEGQFFPESYQTRAGDSDVDVLRRAYAMTQEKLAAAWAQRAPDIPLKTPYEALIMASIIEKETGLGSERALISGVFANRLKKGMKLQTDPTVIYGVVEQLKQKGRRWDGNLTRKHLTTDTPYNTYTRTGLPPTPICLPGEAALLAAVNPEKTKALYFVAKGGGAHYFSETLAEHNKAVKKFQLGQKHIRLKGE